MLECCRRPEHTPEPPAVARRQRPLGRRRGTPSLPASLAPTRKSGKVPTHTPVEAVDPRFRRPPQRWRQGRRRPPPPQERHLGAMLECCRRLEHAPEPPPVARRRSRAPRLSSGAGPLCAPRRPGSAESAAPEAVSSAAAPSGLGPVAWTSR